MYNINSYKYFGYRFSLNLHHEGFVWALIQYIYFERELYGLGFIQNWIIKEGLFINRSILLENVKEKFFWETIKS